MPKRERESELKHELQPLPKKATGDVYSRISDTATQGRGSEAGWTSCPLCNANQKKYALGRGITMHLEEVHTPWNPKKAEKARRQRLKRRIQGCVYKVFQQIENQKGDEASLETFQDEILGIIPMKLEGEDRNKYQQRLQQHYLGDVWNRDGEYEPTKDEISNWKQRVLDIATELQQEYEQNKSVESGKFVRSGLDRNGRTSQKYNDSLPPFIKAAADGNLDILEQMVKKAKDENSLNTLLDTKDRNGSSAEHWSSGNGHLKCLDFLMKVTESIGYKEKITRRRRDGKTSLHYASRNGQAEIIRFLISKQVVDVDAASGDGTTPLHLAMYGGNLESIQCLIEHKADIMKRNDWDCGIGHWIAISIQTESEKLRGILEYVKKIAPCTFEIFGTAQKQGHTSVHKAAQKLNKTFIQWIAEESKSWSSQQRHRVGAPDTGENTPSDIWLKMGGDEVFACWMKDHLKW